MAGVLLAETKFSAYAVGCEGRAQLINKELVAFKIIYGVGRFYE